MSTTHAYKTDEATTLHQVWGGDLTVCGRVVDSLWRTVEVNHRPHPVFTICSSCADRAPQE